MNAQQYIQIHSTANGRINELYLLLLQSRSNFLSPHNSYVDKKYKIVTELIFCLFSTEIEILQDHNAFDFCTRGWILVRNYIPVISWQ